MKTLISIALISMTLVGCSTTEGGFLSIGEIKTKQPNNAKTSAKIDHNRQSITFNHEDGDTLTYDFSQRLLSYKAHGKSQTKVKRSDTKMESGTSWKDFGSYYEAIGDQFKPLLYLGIAMIVFAGIATYAKQARIAAILFIGGAVLLSMFKLAMSPYFSLIALLFIALAITIYVLERKGYLKAIGHGGPEENAAVTRERRKRQQRQSIKQQ